MNDTKTDNLPVILGADGTPVLPAKRVRDDREAKRAVVKAWSSFVSAISNLETNFNSRSKDPFTNHVWVYAAIMAMATNISQVQYRVVREIPDDPATFRKKHGFSRRIKPQFGARRRAVERFLEQRGRRFGLEIRGVEPEYDHPLSQLFAKPNPFQSMSQVWNSTAMFMGIKGACFWLKTGPDGSKVGLGQRPTYVFPMNPDWFSPIYQGGLFVGWWADVPYESDPSGRFAKMRMMVAPWEVILFRYCDPNDPMGWMSPLTAAAAGINTDMAAMAYNRAVLKNGAKPGGILMHEDDIDDDEEKKLRDWWKQQHTGPEKANRMAVLTGAFKYIDIGLGPKDMEYLSQREWDRAEIFAALRVPPSVLALTDQASYATMLSQDKNFWDKNLIPQCRMYEDTLDAALFYDEPDDIVGAFDLTKVEALRIGVKDAVETAVQCCGPALHMPPRIAFDLVGLDVPNYEADDVSFVTPQSIPAGDAADGSYLDLIGGGGGSQTDPGSNDVSGPDQAATPGDDPNADQPRPSTESQRTKASQDEERRRKRIWSNWLLSVQAPGEVQWAKRTRRWITAEKVIALAAYDEAMGIRRMQRSVLKAEANIPDPLAVLPSLPEIVNRLKEATRPLRASLLESAYNHEEELRGTPLAVSLDDPAIQEFFDLKENRFIRTVPNTLLQNLIKTIRRGLEAGETTEAIRERIAGVYDIAASNAYVRTVARTEVASFLNGAKYVMYKQSDITTGLWITAGDEMVRKDHTTFGSSGEHPMDFNYMSLVGGGGTLRYPGDIEAPADEVVNCRCTLIATS